jgi:hypothetical protein
MEFVPRGGRLEVPLAGALIHGEVSPTLSSPAAVGCDEIFPSLLLPTDMGTDEVVPALPPPASAHVDGLVAPVSLPLLSEAQVKGLGSGKFKFRLPFKLEFDYSRHLQ